MQLIRKLENIEFKIKKLEDEKVSLKQQLVEIIKDEGYDLKDRWNLFSVHFCINGSVIRSSDDFESNFLKALFEYSEEYFVGNEKKAFLRITDLIQLFVLTSHPNELIIDPAKMKNLGDFKKPELYEGINELMQKGITHIKHKKP